MNKINYEFNDLEFQKNYPLFTRIEVFKSSIKKTTNKHKCQ